MYVDNSSFINARTTFEMMMAVSLLLLLVLLIIIKKSSKTKNNKYNRFFIPIFVITLIFFVYSSYMRYKVSDEPYLEYRKLSEYAYEYKLLGSKTSTTCIIFDSPNLNSYFNNSYNIEKGLELPSVVTIIKPEEINYYIKRGNCSSEDTRDMTIGVFLKAMTPDEFLTKYKFIYNQEYNTYFLVAEKLGKELEILNNNGEWVPYEP